MANNCFYDLKIVGEKNNVDELIKILQHKHPALRMYRVFSADVYDECFLPNGQYFAIICGDVAWSIYSSMLEGRLKSSINNLTDIESESKRLNLTVEIFSSEPGACFQEHYIINKGEIEVDECPEYNEYWFDRSDYNGKTEEECFTMFCEEYELENITLNDLEDGSVYKTGGLDNYGIWTI